MSITLLVTAGPHVGKEFVFEQHETFLVGRSKEAHFRLGVDDPYFSRKHFMLEINPPRCRILDLGSRNGIMVNGSKILNAELHDQDEIRAGHTVFKLRIPPPDPDLFATKDIPVPEVRQSSPLHTVTQQGTSSLIPDYDLDREIGRGGMGMVYRGVRRADGLPVAIKFISLAASVTQRQTDRFLREAKVLSELSHPHVAGYIDSGGKELLIYLVMELVEGTDAGRVLKVNGPLPVKLAARLVCQTLLALHHAHERGIVHRDVKPSNILVGGSKGKRVVKLADFGLARAYDDCKLSGLTFQGEVGGTPAYMAPEQVTHFRDVQPAADQYAAAATLYHLLTGALPHDLPANFEHQLAVIVNGDVVPIKQRRPDLPDTLANVIHRALSRNPSERYRDVSRFRRALLPFGMM